eukprot:4401621-Prymnesium_polylepis.1
MAASARALHMPVPRVHDISATLHVVAHRVPLACYPHLVCTLNEPFMQRMLNELFMQHNS